MDFVAVAPESDLVSEARDLFVEYQTELGIDLGFQGFEEELAGLPGKYAAPSGVLLVVQEDGKAIGCGALRDLGDGVCELKRIYVRPSARRRGLARAISRRLLDFARQAGYKRARLDTLRRLPGAVELYRSLGFEFIEPYNFNPHPDIVYLERGLD
ncbi:MAG TPA: GNAT family N-acetyltransferase [Fimbriimonadaceae bacterium]|nr:GNAT family N-acetyltransferase [Fimbriimonadaceae bacterium]